MCWDARRVLASMTRLLRDFDRAEEAVHDAFLAAATLAGQGHPGQPRHLADFSRAISRH